MEIIAKIVAALLALAALAYVSVSMARRAKVWVGALACVGSAAIALLVLNYVYRRAFGYWALPDLMAFIVVCGGAGVLGACAAWALARWRPNTSLERTREE
jgi:hypothetical protein